MANIFSDFEIITLEKDHQEPGVFLKARKPSNWKPADLSDIALYSIILGSRTKDLVNLKNAPLIRRLALKYCENRTIRLWIPARIFNTIQWLYCM
ncbi:hypothetical protein GCM10007981_00940 [Thermocladium modestius]|uniref:Uncharacterized protein n=1 Tax=Thermocladium modestius TaxID=62609 RepID=A0A830GSU0_9CREN|nr:hypothetical protein GCM10007981_00940 [Thermocladium modestius]